MCFNEFNGVINCRVALEVAEEDEVVALAEEDFRGVEAFKVHT